MPVIVTAVDVETGEKDDYVVKLNASERMHVESRLRELVAAFMAMEMSLPVVEPAIIDISPAFVKTLQDKPYYVLATKSTGINVGSRYIKDFTTLPNEISLTGSQEAAAQNIFAFDLLIQNSDRNFEKPNMITDGKNLVMLDHELGFGFLLTLSFLRSVEPWKFNAADLLWIEKHCLFKRLKGKLYELDNFPAKLDNLNDGFWERAHELIPDEWMVTEMFLNIKKHVDLIREHKKEFIANIKFILS